ncbi:hypothetical protein ASD53_02375 [Lysobacter sp. Root559]|nr:hypothetical protein ASD53_02375 [Lysobacter sp. Root559]
MILLTAPSERFFRAFHNIDHSLRDGFPVESAFGFRDAMPTHRFEGINKLRIAIHWNVGIVRNHNKLTPFFCLSQHRH